MLYVLCRKRVGTARIQKGWGYKEVGKGGEEKHPFLPCLVRASVCVWRKGDRRMVGRLKWVGRAGRAGGGGRKLSRAGGGRSVLLFLGIHCDFRRFVSNTKANNGNQRHKRRVCVGPLLPPYRSVGGRWEVAGGVVCVWVGFFWRTGTTATNTKTGRASLRQGGRGEGGIGRGFLPLLCLALRWNIVFVRSSFFSSDFLFFGLLGERGGGLTRSFVRSIGRHGGILKGNGGSDLLGGSQLGRGGLLPLLVLSVGGGDGGGGGGGATGVC